MNAAELRIGNWISSYTFLDARPVHYGPKEISKKKVTADDIKFISDNFLATYQGIELTPEILGKCGFEWVVNYHRWVHPETKYEVIEFGPGYGFQNAISREVHQPKLEYVHQLQNLHFALTGKELEINL